MKRKKLTAMLLVFSLVFAGMTGCSKDKETAKTETGSKTTEGASTEGASTEGASTEKATITMMTFDYEGSPLTGDYADQVVQQMEDYTNTHVDFTWVPDANYLDKLSLTLASASDMPMIIAVGGMSAVITGAAEAGAFWDLNDYMYNSDLYPNLSQANKQVNESLTVGGKLIGVYRSRDIGRYGMGYRADWAEKLGLGVPQSIDDVYNMMYQFTYGDPDGNGKDDTYGLSLCKYTGPFDIIQTWFGCGNGWVDVNGELTPVHKTAEYKEALDWSKKMYEDGLVYEDWAVRDTETWQDTVKNGECGIFIDVLDGSRRIWDYFINNNIPSVVDASKTASMQLVGTINGHTLATSGYNGFFVITKAADTEEKLANCLHFLDKMCDPAMQTLSSYGLEDIHWKNENGYLIDIDVEDELSSKNYAALNQTVAYIPKTETIPPIEKNERQQIEADTKAANIDFAVFNPATSFLVNSETYSLNGSTLDQIIADARTQYICGQIDEAGLQAAWDSWDAQGGTQLIAEINEQYKANK